MRFQYRTSTPTPRGMASSAGRWRPGTAWPSPAIRSTARPATAPPDRPLRAVSLRFAGDGATYAVRPEGTSPSFAGHGLAHGDALDSALFPVVWREGRAEAWPPP